MFSERHNESDGKLKLKINTMGIALFTVNIPMPERGKMRHREAVDYIILDTRTLKQHDTFLKVKRTN